MSASVNYEGAQELFIDAHSLATPLIATLLKLYGEEIFEVDPLEIFSRVHEDFNVWISEEGENRIQAILIALSTDEFYHRPEVFKAVCGSLYSGDINDLISVDFEDLTMTEILWAIFEVQLLRGDRDLETDEVIDIDFVPQIHRFMARILNNEAGEHTTYSEDVEDMKRKMIQQLMMVGLHSEAEVLDLPRITQASA